MPPRSAPPLALLLAIHLLLSIFSLFTHGHLVTLPEDIEWNPAYSTNYATANRVEENLVRYIFIHDTQESYVDTLNIFQGPKNYVSSHYVINNHLSKWPNDKLVRRDGHITQMVHDKDVGYHVRGANDLSIGIEHIGFINATTLRVVGGYSWAMYRRSAHMTAWLCEEYDIPVDRGHILGHGECKKVNCTSDHVDPGVDWDWNLYMTMVDDYVSGGAMCQYPVVMESGITVHAAQILLNMTHPDGKWNQQTRDLIREYQEKKDVKDEENMGEKTWSYLIRDAKKDNRWQEVVFYLMKVRYYMPEPSDLPTALEDLQEEFKLIDEAQVAHFLLSGCKIRVWTWVETIAFVALVILSVGFAISAFVAVIFIIVCSYLHSRSTNKRRHGESELNEALFEFDDSESLLEGDYS